MGRREELLRAEAEGWQELLASIDLLPPERLEGAPVNAEGWTVRDVMWHVAYWCADAARVLEAIQRGAFDRSAEPEGPRVDAINDAELERSRRMDTHEVRGELHLARAAMLERFGALSFLTAQAGEWFEEAGPAHYAEHLPEVRAAAGEG